MLSETAICNLALSHLGDASIEGLDEKRAEAEACNRVYALCRDYVLRVHDWGFAKKEVNLADTGAPITHWAYRYYQPSDIIKPRYIVDPTDPNKGLPFEEGILDDLSTKVIDTNQEAAVLCYTARVVDTNLFDAMFSVALSWLIAAHIAIPLTGDKDEMQAALRMFASFLPDTAAADASSSKNRDRPEAEHVRGRE